MISTIFAQVDIGERYGSPWGIDFGIANLVNLVLTIGMTIAGIIILFTFILGGFEVIRGAGNNDPKSTAAGRQALTYSLVGFMIVFVAYWVIRIIEVITGSTFLTNPF